MSNLLDFFKNGVSLPALKEGKYEVVLKSTEFVVNNNNPDNSYIRVTLQDITNGREIITNKFEQGFKIMISHLKKQLSMEDEEVKVQDFLQDLITDETSFNIWITNYVSETQRTSINVNFLPPLEGLASNGISPAELGL